jgi:hypothetical protein
VRVWHIHPSVHEAGGGGCVSMGSVIVHALIEKGLRLHDKPWWQGCASWEAGLS